MLTHRLATAIHKYFQRIRCVEAHPMRISLLYGEGGLADGSRST